MQAMKQERQSADPMEQIKQQLRMITDSIPQGSNIIYLDYPVHDNIGDQLILQGTEAFFRDYGIRVRRRYCYNHFPSKLQIPSDWIIVCHGGGNFGDLYPYYQQFRESVVQRYPNHRIVILPQTVYFENAEEMARSLALFATHRNLHLFVRDEVSYQAVADKLSHVRLAPDMAHQLYPIQADRQGDSRKVLGIMRTDKEAGPGQASHRDFDRTTDWPQLLSNWDRLQLRMIHKAYKWDRFTGSRLPLKPIWYRYSSRLVNKAVRLYNGYDRIVTSRLHGHILACLMSKPNELLDNEYGKNGSYYRLWTHRLSNVQASFPKRGAES